MVAIWVGLCAFLSGTGWVLSACRSLNPTGYLIACALAAVSVFAWQRRTGQRLIPHLNWRKLRWRGRHFFPLAFAVLAGLAILGGVLHAPSNYDGLTYRTPRVLHWLEEGQWHWIHTALPRLNMRATGFEWATAPLLVFLRTDRFNFLFNAVSFLLLPGLAFSLLTRLGVRPRVAWHWMWLLPTGYTYLLQAGSIGNDLFGAVFGLAAIDFALRARTGGRSADFHWSVLAIALVTGSKSSNLILGLPWLFAIWPALRVIWREPAKTLFIGLLAALISVVPTALLNIRYCGDWSGQVLENAAFGGQPVLRLAVNTIGFTLQNFVPPVFPLASQWNAWVKQALPPALAEKLARHFEGAAASFRLGELQVEEAAGLGLGVCALLMLSVGAAWKAAQPTRLRAGKRPTYTWQVCLGAWLSTLFFMSQSGLSGAVRYLAPFYFVLAAPLLWGNGHRALPVRRWWRVAATAVFALAAVLLVLNPARPLWPARTVLSALGAENARGPVVRRAWAVYSIYSQRADAFAPARVLLPADANPLGFVTFDDPETSLWRPFGSRRILHVQRTETAADLHRRGLKYVLVSSEVLQNHWGISLDSWLAQVDGERLATVPLELRASAGPKDWHVVRLR